MTREYGERKKKVKFRFTFHASPNAGMLVNRVYDDE